MSAWGRNVPQFVASRIGRLFPAYWAGVALTGALLLVVWNRHKDVSVSQVLLNLTMLQSAFNVDHLDGVYWTLWVELRFYVIIALFIALGITMNRVVVLAATWPALAAIAHYQDFPFLAEVLVASDAPYFAGGMMLFVISQNPRSTIAWLVLLQNVLIAGAWGSRGTVSGIARNSAVEPTAFAGFAFATACFIAVAICVLTPLRRLNVRWLTGLGALTYPLYITHEYWGWWFISVLSERVGREFTLVLTVAACLLMAWLIHRYIERPFGPRLRRAVQRSVDSLRSSNPESQLSRP
jgi:peptidoglycan/LPS O-acetylase OafA/YrhL